MRFKSSALTHVCSDSHEAFQMTNQVTVKYSTQVGLISPTAVANMTAKTELCKYSIIEENNFNRLNVGRYISFV